MINQLDHLCDRRHGQVRTTLNVLEVAREQMNTDRLRCIDALTALTALLGAHDFGIDARQTLTHTQLVAIAAWPSRDEPLGLATARSATTWGFAIYLASCDGYTDSILPSGLPPEPRRSPRLRLRPLPQRPHSLATTDLQPAPVAAGARGGVRSGYA